MKQALRRCQHLALFLVAATAASVFAMGTAAAGTTGTITGTVTDAASGSPVANVKVTASAPSGSASVVTNAAGFYLLQQLIPDTYT
ncbi:MAG: carboxypeptidase-like regulatory domain-containing protein, partial [Candidatus Eremiobacteraeota bacterium]|nr:carboxypeptidase-like regulatory domain-containing protein [Candidatus Eremiobacteraeota bacterium]